MQVILDAKCPNATKVALVTDNLNIHTAEPFYDAFSPEKTPHRSARRLKIRYTQKHRSWLNRAEIGLSTLASQCLSR
jgi:hypothetical protein